MFRITKKTLFLGCESLQFGFHKNIGVGINILTVHHLSGPGKKQNQEQYLY